MVDDPALEVVVERDQVGSSCLVCAISSCGSNGLPMNPCAPRSAASSAAALVDLAAEHHDRDRADAVPFVHQLQHLPAVDLRHHHVEQHEVGPNLVEHVHSVVGAARLVDGVARHLEVDAHVLAQALVVVDDQHDRAGASLRCRPLQEGVEIAAAVAAVAPGRLEDTHAAAVRPLADRALRDPEVARRLAQGEPIGLGRYRVRVVVTWHRAANLPKASVSETSLFTGR